MRIVWSLPVPGETLESPRGDVVRARSLIEALRRQGHEVVVVQAAAAAGTAAAVSGYRSTVRRLLPAAAPVLRDAGRLLLARAHADRAAARARAEGADLIVETQVHMVGSGARAAGGAGVPLLLDDCSPPSEEAALGGGLVRFAGPLFRAQAGAAARVVASSRALAERLAAEGAPSEKLRVVPNGVDSERFAAVDRHEARRRWGLQEDPAVVYVGSFQPWHRVDLLVEAVARLDGSVRLMLVGDGSERGRTLDRVRELGLDDTVLAPGALSTPEVAMALAACDVAALPGTNEYGHPMKLLEYGAAGLPSVAPDLPPVREVIDPGETGLLFRPGDLDGLVDSLRRLLDDADLRGRMAAAARATATSGSRSWDAAARDLVAGLPPHHIGRRP